MKRVLLFAVAVAVAVAALAAGCGSESDSGSATNVTAVAAAGAAANRDAMNHDDAMKPAGTKLRTVESEYGRVVANGKGEALYLFDRERRGRSECYGACAKAWPPVLTQGKPRAGAGTDPSLFGTVKRRNGKLQVTYAGQPLYYYVGDSPGTILCHDVDEFGGTWLVVQPSGEAAT